MLTKEELDDLIWIVTKSHQYIKDELIEDEEFAIKFRYFLIRLPELYDDIRHHNHKLRRSHEKKYRC